MIPTRNLVTSNVSIEKIKLLTDKDPFTGLELFKKRI